MGNTMDVEVVVTDVGVTEGVEFGLLVTTEDGSGQDCVVMVGSVARSESERHTSH